MNTQLPALRLSESESSSYGPRTALNAKRADLTVAFALDFNSNGEKLTRQVAGSRYVGIPLGMDPDQAAKEILDKISVFDASILNIAGNSLHSLNKGKSKALSQGEVNTWVFEVLSQVHAIRSLSAICSGGQTGVDQAGLVAAIALGIPALGHYPKGYRRRSQEGKDFLTEKSKLALELSQEAFILSNTYRKWHDSEATFNKGEVYVFGASLLCELETPIDTLMQGALKRGAKIYREGATQQMYGENFTSYAVSLRNEDGSPSSLEQVTHSIKAFITYARRHSSRNFFVAKLEVPTGLSYGEEDLAILLARSPINCRLPGDWKAMIESHFSQLQVSGGDEVSVGINIASGEKGLGGGLTNMTELAFQKGMINHHYPVNINGFNYSDAEQAYQSMKIPGNEEYNDGLMIDVIALKLCQHAKLKKAIALKGGVEWLSRCSHFTGAKRARAQSWEGQGRDSRFIRNLIAGYEKAVNGKGSEIRIVHVKEAPFDVYIGRANQSTAGTEKDSIWANPYVIGKDGSREEVVKAYHDYIQSKPSLLRKLNLLEGKTLGCWCKSKENPDTLCHGDVLAALVAGKKWEAPTSPQNSLF